MILRLYLFTCQLEHNAKEKLLQTYLVTLGCSWYRTKQTNAQLLSVLTSIQNNGIINLHLSKINNEFSTFLSPPLSVSYFFKRTLMTQGASQVAQLVKNPPIKGVYTRQRYRFDPWVRKIPWRRKWQPIPLTEKLGGLQSMRLQSWT